MPTREKKYIENRAKNRQNLLSIQFGMNSKTQLTVAKWPFFWANGLLVATAGFTQWFAGSPPSPGAVAATLLLLLIAAGAIMVPYLIEFYWNWQHTQAEERERNEARQQTMAKIGAEIPRMIARLEQLQPQSNPHPEVSPEAAASLSAQFEEAKQSFGQWLEQIEERERKLASETEKLLADEQERRDEFRRYIDQALGQLATATANAAPPAAVKDREEPATSPFASVDKAGEVPPQISPDEGDAAAEPSHPFSEPEAEVEPEAAPEKGAEMNITAEPEIDETSTEPVPPRKRKSAAAKVKVQSDSGISLFSTTTLVATASLGKPHRLYLRGEGPGLSWEEGVPMKWMESDKWSWTTTEATGAIRLQIFRDDEVQDRAGVLEVEPGQTLNVRPDFES